MAVNECKGFFCGGNIKAGSITADKLDKESITELIREIIEEGKDSWFWEIIKEILQDSVDEDWFKKWLETIFKDLINEDWFRDLICSLNCLAPEIFDVIPTDIVFQATGGESSIEIIVDDTAEWELTD